MADNEVKDRYNRKIDYLRISVTDRCNLRCVYCMPETGIVLKPTAEILTYEEIIRIAKVAADSGIGKIRLTGGEPLVRADVVELINELAKLAGLKDISLTTNGVLLAKYAQELKNAGLRRVNISIDSLDPEVYRKLTRGGDVKRVLEGMEAALIAGLEPVKINVVVNRDIRPEIPDLLELIRRHPVHLRFIERMPFNPDENENRLTCGEIMASISGMVDVELLDGPPGAGPAKYFEVAGAKGTVGFICPNTRHICDTCNRLRLTADGRLRVCLFSETEIDIKSRLRAGATDDELAATIREALSLKPKSRDAQGEFGLKRRMYEIGG